MIIQPFPQKEAYASEIIRGPNIKPCPKGKAIENEISAEILIKTGDNITTDHIMPAGSKILPFRSNIPEISKYLFSSLDPDFYSRAMKADNGIIIGGENYGQGSSREHAAIAPMYLGIRTVIAKSFARIHKANLINFGIIPLTFEKGEDYDLIKTGDVILLSGILDAVRNSKSIIARNVTANKEIRFIHDLEGRSKEILLKGGLLQYIKIR